MITATAARLVTVCPKDHHFIVEVIGQSPRYAGRDADAALSALMGILATNGDDGWAVAEHSGSARTGGTYCPATATALERIAINESGFVLGLIGA